MKDTMIVGQCRLCKAGCIWVPAEDGEMAEERLCQSCYDGTDYEAIVEEAMSEHCLECGLCLADDGACHGCGAGRWEQVAAAPKGMPGWMWRLATWLDNEWDDLFKKRLAMWLDRRGKCSDDV